MWCLRARTGSKIFFNRCSIHITAAVAREPSKPFTFEKLSLGEPRSDEVLVKLVASGICHTDVHTKINGYCKFPAVLGHEGVGVIEYVGRNVPSNLKLSKGDHVVMSYASCGCCSSCVGGNTAYCVSHGDLNFSQLRQDGSSSFSSNSISDSDVSGNSTLNISETNKTNAVFGNFFQQSSFASHAISNYRNIVKIDKDLPLSMMAPLGCAVQTGAGAVLNSFAARPGSSIVVFGCGGVGLSAILAAKIASCAQVIAVDVNVNRLRLASELGATHTIISSPDVITAISAATNGQGVNYALDTSGKKESLAAGVTALAPMGVCGFVAPGQTVEIPTMNLLAGKQFRGVIQGDAVPQVFIPQLIQFWREGKLPFERFVTLYKGLTDINQAVEDMKAGKTIKPVLCFN